MVMAKKRQGKIKIPLSKPDNNNNIVQLSINELPEYHHFVDAPDHSFRLFFDIPKSEDETFDTNRPSKKFIRMPSERKPFLVYQDGVKLVGEDIAKTFAILLAKYITNGSISLNNSLTVREHNSIHSLMYYCSRLKEPPTEFSQIDLLILSGWVDSMSEGTYSSYKYKISALLKLHPLSKDHNLKIIRRTKKRKVSKELSHIDFDEIVNMKEYSDRVHFQLLAFVYYEIGLAEDRLKTIEDASHEKLGDDYISFKNLNSKNPTIKRLFELGELGFRHLYYHFYIHIQDELKGVRHYKNKPNFNFFVGRLLEISRIIFNNSENSNLEYENFKDFYLSAEPDNWPLNEHSNPPIFEYLSLKTKHHELAILLYSLLTLGVNKEVALSWKWSVKGKPWYENYDTELGISNKTILRDKKVLLVGEKRKGGEAKVIVKSISIMSPLFKYLRFLDKTRVTGRKYIFSIASGGLGNYMSAFLRHYPILDDNGNRLINIETRKIRKSFTGYKTLELLEGVKNSDDLVGKLREAHNHKNFDTTFSSYMMKSGMSRTVVDSAIVALTVDMLEKAMTFSGKIKEDIDHTDSNETTFLCDCSDPSRPSHGLPIAERCTKYDMCLGCERSEVYSEHLPAICYRILQYEKKREEDPDVFKITLEDRMLIAKDTIEQFKVKHSNGMDIVEQAYIIANQAILSDEPLLPPILQVGAL
jgi:hypothetical protein